MESDFLKEEAKILLKNDKEIELFLDIIECKKLEIKGNYDNADIDIGKKVREYFGI